MWALRLKSYLWILYVDYWVQRDRLQAAMRFATPDLRCRSAPDQQELLVKKIFDAVDWALLRHFSAVKCWHRAFVASRLLRFAGIDAQVRIGVTTGPFSAHAWVEINNTPHGLDESERLTFVQMEGIGS